MEAALELARTAYERHAWREAYDGFLALLESLAVDDLERLGVSAYLVGINPVSDDAWTRAHQTRLGSGDVPGAVRCAFWLAFRLVNAFDRPEGNGWIARIERLVEPASPDSIEAGRLAYLTGLRAAFEGDLDTAAADLARSAEIASLWRDDELAALARLSLGRVRIFLGEITPGVRLLGEAMLVVRSAAMSAIAVGDSYCTAIDACYDLFDVQRGQAWTKGLTDWCAPQPDLESAVGSGYDLVVDTGTFHGLTPEQQLAMGREVTAITSKHATVILDCFAPRNRGPLPRGCTQGDVVEAFPDWVITDIVDADTDPDPIAKVFKFDEVFYRLSRAPQPQDR